MHTLEHGSVIVYYRPPGDGGVSPEVGRRLSTVVEGEPATYLIPYPTLPEGQGLAVHRLEPADVLSVEHHAEPGGGDRRGILAGVRLHDELAGTEERRRLLSSADLAGARRPAQVIVPCSNRARVAPPSRRLTRVIGVPERAPGPPRSRYSASTRPQSACAPTPRLQVDPAVDEVDAAASRAARRAPRAEPVRGAPSGTPRTPPRRLDRPVLRDRAPPRSHTVIARGRRCGRARRPRRTAARRPRRSCVGEVARPGRAHQVVVALTDRAGDVAVGVDPHAVVGQRRAPPGARRRRSWRRRSSRRRGSRTIRPESPRTALRKSRILPIAAGVGRQPRREGRGAERARPVGPRVRVVRLARVADRPRATGSRTPGSRRATRPRRPRSVRRRRPRRTPGSPRRGTRRTRPARRRHGVDPTVPVGPGLLRPPDVDLVRRAVAHVAVARGPQRPDGSATTA